MCSSRDVTVSEAAWYDWMTDVCRVRTADSVVPGPDLVAGPADDGQPPDDSLLYVWHRMSMSVLDVLLLVQLEGQHDSSAVLAYCQNQSSLIVH